ncbi:MAG: succinate CoA transferase [Chitinivibrionales bacterium]|nr:succinate CoA transferase [Chitinivibrionales bacterium]MBD3395084.1 succinate CoA transferase [Chitinivibrionales bacterium]
MHSGSRCCAGTAHRLSPGECVGDVSRIACAALRARIMPADQAAGRIADGDNVGMSGFTGAGYPKAVPQALAARMRAAASRGDSLKIGVWTGASTGPELDGALAAAGGMAMRVPYQADPASRRAINTGETRYVDAHLSKVAGLARDGCFGHLNWALIEVTRILEDGRFVPSTSVGNNQTWFDLADKVILEVNSWQSDKLEGIHDIQTLHGFGGAPLPLTAPCDRFGSPYLTCPAEKIAAVVETHAADRNSPFTPPDETSRCIAGHILDFLEREVRAGRMPEHLHPLQTGVGNVANAVLAGFADSRFANLTAYTEVIQDSMLDLLREGRMRCASATSFSVSPPVAAELDSILDGIRDRVVLRPQEISNHPGVIRRLGCVAINTMLEADIYGNVNSTCVMGSRMQNGIGGSGDFTRNAYLSFFVSPSIAKNGAVSCIVPMAPHVDHPDHDVHVLVTECGLADLRGLSPAERAGTIIENCAHPRFRDALRDYFKRAKARSHARHCPHLLAEALSWHERYIREGSMR